MGEFTQNLLKLTEFPFSYSLIGLLSLIFANGSNSEDLSFEKIGPLFILMGFVATTLSICDPVGAVQRIMIKGWDWQIRTKNFSIVLSESHFKPVTNMVDFVHSKALGQKIGHLFPLTYVFAIASSPEDIKKRGKTINWDLIKNYDIPNQSPTDLSHWTRRPDVFDELEKIQSLDLDRIYKLLKGLIHQAVSTKWITAEIDRITALVYFMVIISLFIVASQLYPIFFEHFTETFEELRSIKLIILIFSVAALLSVIIMFILRIRGLLNKSSIVFMYLVALGTIKKDKENFKGTFQEIERYLNDSHWTLAEYWVDSVQREYSELYMNEVRK